MDINGDGSLNRKDFERLLSTLGQNINSDEIDDIWKMIDTDGSNSITFNEFVKIMLLCYDVEDREDTLREAFLVFDRNRDGNLQTEEVVYTLEMLGTKLDKAEQQELKLMIDK